MPSARLLPMLTATLAGRVWVVVIAGIVLPKPTMPAFMAGGLILPARVSPEIAIPLKKNANQILR